MENRSLIVRHPDRTIQTGRGVFSITLHRPEGVDLNLNIKPSQPLKLKVLDQSFELPASLTAAFKPRPPDKIPTAYPFNPYGDGTIVTKSFAF